MNKLIIIHPQDPSTSFLSEIVQRLQEMFPSRDIVLKPEVAHTHEYVSSEISKHYKDNDVIVFLGHGRSNSLYGGLDERGNKSTLLTLDHAASIFKEKHVILFACNSNDLLKKIGSGVKTYVGFGNMPTDWDEIIAHRDISDHKYLEGLTNNSLKMFKDILVQMMVAIIGGLFSKHNYSREAYLQFRLELNKSLVQIANDNGLSWKERTELFKVVQCTKNDIIYKD